MIFDLYEKINCKRTNKYYKVRHVIDPFYIRTHFHTKIGRSGHQRRSASVWRQLYRNDNFR